MNVTEVAESSLYTCCFVLKADVGCIPLKSIVNFVFSSLRSRAMKSTEQVANGKWHLQQRQEFSFSFDLFFHFSCFVSGTKNWPRGDKKWHQHLFY